jgi:hypothetical protein
MYNRALVLYFAWNAAVWIPWGITCLLMPGVLSGEALPDFAIFDLGNSVARTEVMAMYGGLQIAIGLLALVAIFRPEHRATTLLFYVIAMSCFALARLYGIRVAGVSETLAFGFTLTTENYNQMALGMYEVPAMLFAWALLFLKPGQRA